MSASPLTYGGEAIWLDSLPQLGLLWSQLWLCCLTTCVLVFPEMVQGGQVLPWSDEIGKSSQRHVQMTSGSITAGWILIDVSMFLVDRRLFLVSLVWPALYICCQLVALTGLICGIVP